MNQLICGCVESLPCPVHKNSETSSAPTGEVGAAHSPIRAANNSLVTVSEHDSQAPSEIDSEFIVKAVNAHDALVEALQALYSYQQTISSPDTRWELPVYQQARAAIRLANGENK